MSLKEEGNLAECLAEKNICDGKFNTLRLISLKAISEFESLQKKCEENYAKYLEERENYMRTKKELDVLKEASGDALGDYENLHRKFEIEQDCRDKAEEFATKAVLENKKLKRQSTYLLNALNTKLVDFDLEELAKVGDDDASTTVEDHALCNEQIAGLKQQVEILRIKTDDAQQKITETEDKLKTEQQENRTIKEELENNKANLKQLRRVSQLALDEYIYLKQKYTMETQHREQAEKIADEVARDHEAMVKQNEVVLKDISEDDRLKKALEEISTLTKQLHDQKTEFEEKVKELEEELSSSNDIQKLENVEKQVEELGSVLQNYEERLEKSQTRATQAEERVSELEKELKTAKENQGTIAPPVAPSPPPPPPPPPPVHLMSKFAQIIGGGKKKKTKKGSQKEDPRVKAMCEMMDRIKHGQVTLRKISHTTEAKDKGEAIENLKFVLKKLNESPNSKERSPEQSNENQKIDFGVKLKPATMKKNRSVSDADETSQQIDLRTNLRKPRSRSTGDVLDNTPDDVDGVDKQLRDLLNKRKAVADKDTDDSVNSKATSESIENDNITATMTMNDDNNNQTEEVAQNSEQ